MNIAPWFKFYAADYLLDGDVDDLPLEAQAILVRIWAVLWIEGEIPDDPIQIARKCRIEVLQVQMHMQNLHEFFAKTEDGMLISVRMEAERSKSGHVSRVRSNAAKAKHEKVLAANAQAKPDAKQPANMPAKTVHSESESESDIKTKPKPSAAPAACGVSNSQTAKATTESRHSRLEQIVRAWYQDWAGVECPWGPGEGNNLSRMLKSTPNWPDHQFVTCLENLARSDCVAKGDRPREWLEKLPKFLHGPLDRFWKPIGRANGTGTSKGVERINRNREAIVLGVTGQSGHVAAGHHGPAVRDGPDAGIHTVLEGEPVRFVPKPDP